MIHRRQLLQGTAIIALTMVALAAPLASPAQAATTLKLSTVFPEGHHSTNAMMEFAERIEEETNGDIKIRVFPSSTLGDYTTIYEEVRRGSIDMALQNVPSQFDPRVEIATLNYAVMNADEAKKLMGPEGFITKKMEEFNAAVGVQTLGGLYALGFGGLGLMKEPADIANPGTPKDLLLRVPGWDTFQSAMGEVGFQTVSIPYADLFTSLQTGVADGWAGGGAEVNYTSFRDVIKYYVPINNYFETYSFLMNADAYEALTQEQKELFQTVAGELTTGSIDVAEAAEMEHQKKLADAGITIVPFSDDDRKAWAEYVRENAWDASKGKMGEDLIEELLAQY